MYDFRKSGHFDIKNGANIMSHIKKDMPPMSQRMIAVADMVTDGSRVADIGCDHGYISIYLCKSGRCDSVIASDIRKGPLEAARENIKRYGCADKVRTRLSDGLENIQKGEADCIVISGMGGGLIVSILSADNEKLSDVKELVLEPQSDAPAVRKYLYSNQYVITQEGLVEEKGKYYPVIKAVKTTKTDILDEEEYVFGPCLLKNKDRLLWTYLNKEKKRISGVLTSLKAIDTDIAKERIIQLKNEAEIIKRAMDRYGEIILASGSPRRRELLEQIGIHAQISPSNADEKIELTEPEQIVRELSRRKCESVSEGKQDGIIIGADTIVVLEGQILGKPMDENNAEEMLKKLSGKTHQVYTGVTIIKKKSAKELDRAAFVCVTDVEFADIDEDEIRSYVSTGEPLDKAGAYGIQGIFARYVKRINGDYYNVVGLPVSALYAELKRMKAV